MTAGLSMPDIKSENGSMGGKKVYWKSIQKENIVTSIFSMLQNLELDDSL